MPSWPWRLFPQPSSSPPSVRARECPPPQASAAQRGVAARAEPSGCSALTIGMSTATGIAWLASAPVPSCPQAALPQLYSEPQRVCLGCLHRGQTQRQRQFGGQHASALF